MTIDTGQAVIRTVIAGAIVESYDASGRAIDALLAMRQAEAIVRVTCLGRVRDQTGLRRAAGDDPGVRRDAPIVSLPPADDVSIVIAM